MAGRDSRMQAQEHRQNLSPAEEKTLVRWIARLTKSGYPASPALVLEMAEEIAHQRYQLSKAPPLQQSFGKHWLERFRARHTEIQGVWTRQIESARYNATNVEVLKTWFDAVTELCIEHQYELQHIYNMDESGFAIGASQSSRALVNIRERSSWKVVRARQEWITAIECVSASGRALPPLLIFKAKYTNTAWIPPRAPPDWRFSTSQSGWTSDSHAYEWLTTVFQPATMPDDPSTRRLLIMDGHGSHITANVISFCMNNAIDLLILPPHTSHLLQPLDVSVFGPLKRSLAAETDAASRLDPGRIQRVEWTETYIRARSIALSSSNIKSGWRATGLSPLSPITVLEKVRASAGHPSPKPHTPVRSKDLDTSLLFSSPPDGTELRQANAVLNSELSRSANVPSPVKRYTARMTRAFESTQSELVTLRKRLADAEELLQTRKARKTGKRVSLQGRFVFSTVEVLEIAQQAEAASAKKKARQTKTSRPNCLSATEVEATGTLSNSSDSESDCIVVARR